MPISKHARRLGTVIGAVAVAATLASCGGSDDGGNGGAVVTPTAPASNTPPASASASSTGFIAYLKVLTTTTPETVEPLDLTNFVAPTDDTGAFDPTI